MEAPSSITAPPGSYSHQENERATKGHLTALAWRSHTHIISTLVHWPEIATMPQQLQQGCEIQRSIWIFRKHYIKCLWDIRVNPTSHACNCTAKRGTALILRPWGDIHEQEGPPAEKSWREKTAPGTTQHCWVVQSVLAPLRLCVTRDLIQKQKKKKSKLFKPL